MARPELTSIGHIYRYFGQCIINVLFSSLNIQVCLWFFHKQDDRYKLDITLSDKLPIIDNYMDVPTCILSRKTFTRHDRYLHSWLLRYVGSVKHKCEISSRKAMQLLRNGVNIFEISTMKGLWLTHFCKVDLRLNFGVQKNLKIEIW